METLIFIGLLFLFLWAAFWLPILGVLSKKKEVKADIDRQQNEESASCNVQGKDEEWKRRIKYYRKGKKSFDTY